MQNIDRIKDKIRALLAKAQATDASGEADVFMAKAEELMTRYQLDLFDLGQEDPIGATIGVRGQPGPASYKATLQMRLARYYGARPIRRMEAGGRSWFVHIVGPESARYTTEIMTDFVWFQVLTQGSLLSKVTGEKKDACVRSVTKALCHRIAEEILARKEHEARPGTSHSLVVVDAVKSFVEANYSNLRPIKTQVTHVKMTAIEAAGRISIAPQIGTKAVALLK